MQITLFAGIDSNFNLKGTFKMCAILIASFEIISMKNRHVNLTIFLLLPVSALDAIVHN